MMQTVHREAEVQSYASRIMDMIGEHLREDGGFSCFLDHGQTEYQGRRIAASLTEDDMHGACFLTGPIAMIDRISEDTGRSWAALKP
jgi:hypothetical protein